MDATKPRIGALQIGIIVLALSTALIHLFLATLGPATFTVLFLLNGIGYIVLTVCLFLPRFARHRRLIHWLFIAYTATTILAYFVIGQISTLGLVTKLIEVLLIILLFLDNRR